MKTSFFTLFISALLLLASCARPAQYRRAEGGVWNTTYHIVYKADRDLRDSIITVMKQVEMSLSPFAKTSLISRINRNEEGVAADSLLRRIFTESQRINRISGGAFDPTVAPLVNLWGFGYKNGQPDYEPGQRQIDSLLELVGIMDCGISPEGVISKKRPGTEFNFSAITKGYGVDLVGEMLARNGASDYMVEIGGEIVTRGKSPRMHPWSVAIDAPVRNDTAPVHERLATVRLTDAAIATSGNYRNYRTTSHGLVWHTISPSTGRPAHTDILSATVIAPDCMTADALATSCMAMYADSAISMIESVSGAEALLVVGDSTVTTSGFPELY